LKKWFHIFVLLFLTLINCSCGLIGGGKVSAKPKGDSAIVKDDDVDVGVDSSFFVEETFGAEHNSVVLTSSNYISMGDAYSYNHNSSRAIRIIEVKNTKVIKQSSDLSEGRIVYKIPDVMKVRSTYKVLVRISKSKNVISVYDSLQGTVRESVIPITETMEVKLLDISPADNKSFEIVDGNSAVQMIEDGDTYTEWSWNVTPVRVGKSNLKIVVSVIRGDNKKDIVYEDSVEVEKDIPTQVGFFFKKYWQVFMTAVAIPLIVFLYKRRKEKKKEKQKVDSEEKEVD